MLGDVPSGEAAGEPALPAHDEVAVLDDPYLSRYTIDDFPRLKAMRAEFFGAHGIVCTERPRLITEYYREHGFETDAEGREIDPELRQAGALHHLLVNKEPLIRDRALLAGTTTTKFPGVVIYPEMSGLSIWAELTTVSNRELSPYHISAEDVDLLNQDVFPYWIDRNVREWTRREWNSPRCQQLDERWVLYFMWKTAAVSHTIPDYPAVLERGLLSFREDAARLRGDRGRRAGPQLLPGHPDSRSMGRCATPSGWRRRRRPWRPSSTPAIRRRRSGAASSWRWPASAARCRPAPPSRCTRR